MQEVLLVSVCDNSHLTTIWSYADESDQFMAAFVASFLAGQPLLISGVTGVSGRERATSQKIDDTSQAPSPCSIRPSTISSRTNPTLRIISISWAGRTSGRPSSTGSRRCVTVRWIAMSVYRKWTDVVSSCTWSEMGHPVLVRYVWVLRRSRVRPIWDTNRHKAVPSVFYPGSFPRHHVGIIRGSLSYLAEIWIASQ